MSALDVEALLESTAHGPITKSREDGQDQDDRRRHERNDKDRHRDGSQDRDRNRRRRERSLDRPRRHRDTDGDEAMRSPKDGSTHGSHRSARRSRSRELEHRGSRRDRPRQSGSREDGPRSSGDFYRGGGRPRERSKSPDDGRHYRPSGRGGRDREDRQDRRDRDRSYRERESERGERAGQTREANSPSKAKSPTPQPTEDERDRRTVFVQQLAARLRTRELIQFFEKVGPVKEAQIVKDRVSGRSKG